MNKVKLVGILNITPDSFSDGGQFEMTEAALKHAKKLFAQGATWVDIGAEATNPFVSPITAQEEWERLKAVAEALLTEFPGRISIDSYHPEIHRRLANAHWGEFIINDVTGFNNPDMVAVASERQLPVIVSHLPARFGTDIQAAHQAKPQLDDIEVVASELLGRRQQLIDAGVPPSKIILDPGIGFGKTMELNRQLLEFPAYIKQKDPDLKVMIGYSRKRFLGDNRMELEPNLEAGRIAIASGADYLRVHDVTEHKQLLPA